MMTPQLKLTNIRSIELTAQQVRARRNLVRSKAEVHDQVLLCDFATDEPNLTLGYSINTSRDDLVIVYAEVNNQLYSLHTCPHADLTKTILTVYRDGLVKSVRS
jgi:hypothetical protein